MARRSARQQHGGAEQIARPRSDERLEGGLVVGPVLRSHWVSPVLTLHGA
jgi:hypothetical protein